MLEAIPLDAELKVGSLLHRMPVNHRSNTQSHQRHCGGKNKKNNDDILLINLRLSIHDLSYYFLLLFKT